MFKHEFNFSQMKESFPDLVVDCAGSPNKNFLGISSAEVASEASLVFCTKISFAELAVASKAAGIVVAQKNFADLKARAGDKIIISSPNPELLMAKTINRFLLEAPYRDVKAAGVHSTAVVDSSAKIDPSATICAGAVIGRDVKIGAKAYVGANSVIESFSEIGAGTVIQALVVIGTRVKVGASCEISSHTIVGKEGFGYAHDAVGNHVRIPHQGWVVIEDDVQLGANNTIDRGTFFETRIGRGTKTDNQVHVAHNCKIGRGCLLTSGFKMAGSSTIGNFVVTGGNTVIGGHLSVTDGVNLAALSAVSKNVTVKGDYGGSPLMPVLEYTKARVAITHLPEMRKQLRKLMAKIFPEE